MTFFVIFIPIFLVIMVGLCFLQAYLSKREGKVPGLIIPGISFLFSLIWPLNMYPEGGTDSGFAMQMLFVLLLANIPTYIYLAIYFICREKRKKQMDKMNIQDLD